MCKAKSLLLIATLLVSGLNAQQPLWHISPLAEETLNAVGQDKLNTAWFVTGQDTVYTIHLKDSKIVGCTTPYDFDTTWTDDDSLYQRHIDFLKNTEKRTAYASNKSSVTSYYDNGKRVRRIELQLDEKGEMKFHWDWAPEQQVESKMENGKEVMKVFNPGEPWAILFKSNDDTTKRWNIQGDDTTLTSVRSKGYSYSYRRHHKGYYQKIVSIEDSGYVVSYFPEKTDSIFSIHSNTKNSEVHYTKSKEGAYQLLTNDSPASGKTAMAAVSDEDFYAEAPIVAPYYTHIEILSAIDNIDVNGQPLDVVIKDSLEFEGFESEFRESDEWWAETIIIEIAANDSISGVIFSPASEFYAWDFQNSLQGLAVIVPKKLQTVLYYMDGIGKKKKQKLEYILLPLKVQAQSEYQY